MTTRMMKTCFALACILALVALAPAATATPVDVPQATAMAAITETAPTFVDVACVGRSTTVEAYTACWSYTGDTGMEVTTAAACMEDRAVDAHQTAAASVVTESEVAQAAAWAMASSTR